MDAETETVPGIEHLKARFESYARLFVRSLVSEADRENVKLKIDHTLRVLAEAKFVTEAAGFRGRTVELALAGALFHDVGRFEQYAVFKT
ncbi:MAG: hypothetical protein EOM25_13905, partial [Deltaproteobacteria bacterium]|nr:hypothetical protein [Deltaproteobacteria bacterium]